MMTEQTIRLENPAAGIVAVVLTRPAAANALNSQMALELKDFFANIDKSVRVIILTGESEKAFCAGADLKERVGFSLEEWEAQHQLFREVLNNIINCPVPVIAAVNGAAYGGGFELALACDFIYASENARFSLPEVTLGIMCGTGGTQTLPTAVGSRLAREILYTGRFFSAEKALDYGLVNRVIANENLFEETLETAKTMAKNAPLALCAIKRVTSVITPTLADGLRIESENYKKLLKTNDCTEGLLSFKEKREARFSGN